MEVSSILTGKRGVSLPFTDSCEPIAADRTRFHSLLDDMISHGRKAHWKYLELRGGAQYLEDVPPHKTYFGHVLPIHSDEDDLLRKANPATRRNIRKAVDSGVRVRISDTLADLDTYYDLHCLTRKRHGLPPQPHAFFRSIHRNVIAAGKGFTVIATHRSRPVAGAVFFHSGRKGIYKFGASDFRFQHLRANNLVMWEAIRWFSQNCFEELSFGRTDLDHAGLIRFKEGWGARRHDIHYYRYDFKRAGFLSDSAGSEEAAARVFRALPVSLLKVAGELLYRHVG